MSVWREQVQIYLLAPQWTATLNTVLVCWVASHSLNFLMNVWTCRWFREATSTSAWMNLNIDFSERTEIGPIIHKMCVCGVTRTMNYNWIRLLKDIVSKKKTWTSSLTRYVKYKFDYFLHSFSLFWGFFVEHTVHFACFPTSVPLAGDFNREERL